MKYLAAALAAACLLGGAQAGLAKSADIVVQPTGTAENKRENIKLRLPANVNAGDPTDVIALGFISGLTYALIGVGLREGIRIGVSGKIASTNKGDAAQFDRPMLEALGMSGFETTTPWYPGPVRFDGVRVRTRD